MEWLFNFTWYLGEWITAWVGNQWPPFIVLDPHRSMFYVRTLTLDDMWQMKSGSDFVGWMDNHNEYAPTFNDLWLI